ncbi:histidinol dehydrogenase [Paenarthrobacter sp. NPDC089714]|uniref:histidinol dehydrogenase n=1 Tax=Paenarthrobacter sp. NPDC089714 TaxID=3364377 RepID=UPI0037F5C14C
MISLTDLRGLEFTNDLLPRAEVDIESTADAVRPLLEEVRTGGMEALLSLSERLDGVRPDSLRVPRHVIEAAADGLDEDVRAALLESIKRARRVHEDQVRRDTSTVVADNAVITERWLPVDRVGLYVPGGRAVYPSSVVMNVVPAQAAGVPSIAIASPPQKEFGGYPHPSILAAAALLGVDEVYAVGGAQAIALFAYGAPATADEETVRPVDLVTGPGNIWVATAKRLLKGRIGIDAEAGPTEVMIIADEQANPAWLAADLISQAEHDVLAAAVLVTDSETLAHEVIAELGVQVPEAKHAARIEEALRGRQSGILLVENLDKAVEVANGYAAEHLEIQTADPQATAARIRNAGAVFVGGYAPVSLGDYCAGSNHVLPTGGTGRHSSGLSVQSFLRGIHFIEYSREALHKVAGHVKLLSETENLPAHGRAVTIREDRPVRAD